MENRLLRHMIAEIEKVKMANGTFLTNSVENEPMKDDPDADKLAHKVMRTAVAESIIRVEEHTLGPQDCPKTL